MTEWLIDWLKEFISIIIIIIMKLTERINWVKMLKLKKLKVKARISS